MCPFEILHFAPLALIAISLFVLKSSSNKLLFGISLAVLSLVGLVAGSHMHTEHFEPYAFFDPCYGYIIALIVSAFAIFKGIIEKNVAKNKA